jgi:hypothetical protein
LNLEVPLYHSDAAIDENKAHLRVFRKSEAITHKTCIDHLSLLDLAVRPFMRETGIDTTQ